MRIIFYFLTFIFGFFGILALLRTIERLVAGAGILPAQVLIAFVTLLLAVVCLRKARGSIMAKK